MFPGTIDLYRVLPELFWCGFGALAMLMQPFVRNRHFFTILAFLGALAGTAASCFAFRNAGPGFYGLIQSDAFSFFFHLLVGTVALLVILAAGPYLDRERHPTMLLCNSCIRMGSSTGQLGDMPGHLVVRFNADGGACEQLPTLSLTDRDRLRRRSDR